MKVNQPNLIFIVDDNSNNLRILFNFLKSTGFRVLVSTNGEDALRKLTEISPNLILLDVRMPTIDGFEVCRRLKKNPATQHIPIIFMTALADLDNKIQGFALGAVDYITKPFQQEEVLSRISLHLRLHELTSTLQETNQQLTQEIAARKTAENQLKQLNQQLEQRVIERTRKLNETLQKLQAREEKLIYEASHDLLTGLLNRAWLMQHLSEILGTEQLLKRDCAVLFLDLDRFKSINDRFGHLQGDELLKKVAKRLQTSLDSSANIVRLGGDEFLILLAGKWQLDRLNKIANHLLSQLRNPFYMTNYQVFLDASIGIVPSITSYLQPTAVLRDADIAMYQAKARGRGNYVFLTAKMQTKAIARIQLEADLQRAIKQEEFCLYYQPIFELATQKLVGFEALMRWRHPEEGLLSPAKFITLAEEIGQIQALDLLGFRLACEQLKNWQNQFGAQNLPTINVNFSPTQFQKSELFEQISLILNHAEIVPQFIKIEITESVFLETASKAIQFLHQIHNLGIKLCIDDFGTGYSSLSRLHSFPLDTLKIDRSFILRLQENSEGTQIVQTIISLAHNLGIDVVAEGIETEEQLAKLIELECEFGQGYLFAKPISSQQATQLLNDRLHLFLTIN
ncbi:two-component system response regulator [Oscillatoria salina]|uniref:two-component system response regulator n=1 Tax=Oscillatoria salina TaxID=331517 RepID=UPI001CC9451E|nr:EAL domain-containing response regulator [Oscillatoria salina]MBZ8179220.1 EAL domain-containing protein [Oscillatoria salina IIICB1]